MKNILVIGANGFTGRKIVTELVSKGIYNVTACSLSEDIAPHAQHHFIRTDIRQEKAIQELYAAVRPDVVINTAAISAPDYCEAHPEEAQAINATAVKHLACACEAYNSRFIQLSTDFVFDGVSNELYVESDEPRPINYYGVTKFESEQLVAQYCSNYAIARIVVVYGKSLPGQHGNIMQLVAQKLRAGEPIRVVSDQWRTPTFVDDVAQGIEQLLFHHSNGIYHLCGKDCLTVADMAYRVAHHLQLDASLIQPVTTEEMQESTPRPRFSGLDIMKAQQEINYHPHSLDEGIKKMFL